MLLQNSTCPLRADRNDLLQIRKVLNFRAESKRRATVTKRARAQNKFINRLRCRAARRVFATGAPRYADKLLQARDFLCPAKQGNFYAASRDAAARACILKFVVAQRESATKFHAPPIFAVKLSRDSTHAGKISGSETGARKNARQKQNSPAKSRAFLQIL